MEVAELIGSPRTWASTVVAAVVLLVLAACIPTPKQPLTDDDIVGEWEYVSSVAESRLVFLADGTFSIDSLPRAAFTFDAAKDDLLKWIDPVAVVGEWRLREDDIHILFQREGEDDRQGANLHYRRDGNGGSEIFTYIGGPDVGVRLTWVRSTDFSN